MANPIAVPGTNVPSGAAVSPGGAQGVTGTAGTPAWTTCTSSFTIPAVGSTVSVPVVDTSWVTVGEMLYVDQAGGTGQSGILQVTAKTSNSLTLLNPTPPPAIPPADSIQAGLLKQLSGNTTDFVDGTNTCQNLVTAVQPTIWSARLRSFQALGNNTFECDQRLCGSSAVFGSVFGIDRWNFQQTGLSANATGQQISGNVVVPGTNFNITSKFLRVTLTAQKASLAASDNLSLNMLVEGPMLRELLGDVTSFQVLARSSVALSFGVAIRDSTTVRSLTKLCTLSSANTWSLIPCPNIPVWDPGGVWVINPGAFGYALQITLAGGSSTVAPANNTWQNGSYTAALGQDSFASKPVNSTFDLAFVSHEPGAQCSTPMDKPFTQNYDDCLRYYQKSYDYAVKPGSVSTAGAPWFIISASLNPWVSIPFVKRLASDPTVAGYSPNTGAVNNVRDASAGVDRAISGSPVQIGQAGFGGFNVSSSNSSTAAYTFHYTADTGW